MYKLYSFPTTQRLLHTLTTGLLKNVTFILSFPTCPNQSLHWIPGSWAKSTLTLGQKQYNTHRTGSSDALFVSCCCDTRRGRDTFVDLRNYSAWINIISKWKYSWRWAGQSRQAKFKHLCCVHQTRMNRAEMWSQKTSVWEKNDLNQKQAQKNWCLSSETHRHTCVA